MKKFGSTHANGIGGQTNKSAATMGADKRKTEKAADKKRAELEKRESKEMRARENDRRRKSAAAEKASVAAREKARRDAERARRKKSIESMRKAREAERAKLKKARAELAAARLKKRKAVYAVIKSKLKNRSEGFDYRNYGVLPRTELRVCGDRTSVAARLSASGISVCDLRVENGKTCFKIRKKDMAQAIAILDEMCYNYDTGAKFGMGRRVAFWLARAGLLLGAMISVAGLYISYGYVWRIEIDGNEKLSSAAIESALKNAGVRAGRKKSEIAPIALSALDGLDGVADASCEIYGTTLYVRVLESKEFTEHGKNGAYIRP